MDKDYISHHGIKGMKWGVRRTPEQLGHKPVNERRTFREFLKSKRETGSSSSNKSSSTKPKSVSEMSDDELRAKLNRLNMEKQYRQLTAEMTPKKEHKIRKLVGEISTQAVKTISNKTIDKIANNLFKDKDGETVRNIVDVGKASNADLKKATDRLQLENKYRSAASVAEKAESERKEASAKAERDRETSIFKTEMEKHRNDSINNHKTYNPHGISTNEFLNRPIESASDKKKKRRGEWG